MDIYLIRHTSVDVPPGICYGQTDVPLRSTFPEEAAETLHRLKEAWEENTLSEIGKETSTEIPQESALAFDRVYTSPLSRCMRLAAYCGFPDAVRDVRLLELNFGAWEMVSFSENSDPHLQTWYADYLHVPATGGESFAMLYARVAAFLDELRGQSALRRVALFAHGGVLLSALVYAGRVKEEEAFASLPPYGSVVHLSL